MESRPAGGGNFIGTLFIVLIMLGIGIAASSLNGAPAAVVIPPAEQPALMIPDTGAAQTGELQGQVILPPLTTDEALSAQTPLEECIVLSGDTLAIIARRHGVTVEQILALNPQVTDPNLIYPGQALRLPHEAAPGETASEPILPSTGGTLYIVQPGDTLSSIAVRYNTSIAEILSANPTITNPNLLSVGQTITIPG